MKTKFKLTIDQYTDVLLLHGDEILGHYAAHTVSDVIKLSVRNKLFSEKEGEQILSNFKSESIKAASKYPDSFKIKIIKDLICLVRISYRGNKMFEKVLGKIQTSSVDRAYLYWEQDGLVPKNNAAFKDRLLDDYIAEEQQRKDYWDYCTANNICDATPAFPKPFGFLPPTKSVLLNTDKEKSEN